MAPSGRTLQQEVSGCVEGGGSECVHGLIFLGGGESLVVAERRFVLNWGRQVSFVDGPHDCFFSSRA